MKTLFATCLCACLLAVEPPAASTFADGEVVAFVGDSITHDGRWLRCIADYYATRFPDRRVAILNAGIAGDNAAGAMKRLDADVLHWNPTSIVVMLGMNDCGRDAYRPGSDADPQYLSVRERSLTVYNENMGRLAARLKPAAQRVLLVTPSPYEDTAQLAAANLPGANAGLGRGAGMLARIAESSGLALIDFHAPMTRLDLERQRLDPAFTLVGPDRVHPASPGHLVMAWLFLKAQGAPALVSRTVIDARTRTAQAENAVVTEPSFAEGGVAFTLTSRSLPFPISNDARPALDYASIVADLDREEMVVTGLADGSWRLEIDGAAVATHSATELAAGVNLALVATTPQYRQAQRVMMLNEERRSVERRLRAVAMVQHKILKPDEADQADPSQVLAAVERRLAANPDAFQRKMLEECRTSLAEVPALRAKVLAMSDGVRLAAMPKSHRYRISPVKNP